MMLRAIDHDRAYSEADQAPKPDALHGRLERDVERSIDDHRHGIAGDEKEQSSPVGLPAAASDPHRAHHHTEPGGEGGPPPRPARDRRPRPGPHPRPLRTSGPAVARVSVYIDSSRGV